MESLTRTISSWLLGATLSAALSFPTSGFGADRIIYYHLDALGSPVSATDEQGNVIWRETYQPYGERIKKESSAAGNSRWYTGHPEDPETGLVYAGARYYDPVIGRFLAVDPVAFEEGTIHSFNRYAYAANNPYKYFDPDGRRVVISGHVAAGGAGYLYSPTVPSYHLSLVLIPDNPQHFDRYPGFPGWNITNGTVWRTLGGQPGGNGRFQNPLGNLVSQPNNPDDSLANSQFQQEVPTPEGMTDTDFINRLIRAADSYGGNLNYDTVPGEGDS